MINGLGVRRLGRGRHRGRGGDARPAAVHAHARGVGFELTGELPAGATATDLVLTVTQILRKEGVVDKFVEFFGPGVSSMKLADRATIGQHGARVRGHDGLLPHRRARRWTICAAPAARRPKCNWSSATPRSSSCSAPTAARRRRVTPRCCSSTWARSSRAWPGPSGRRTACRWTAMKESFRKALAGARSNERGFALDRSGRRAHGHRGRQRPQPTRSATAPW